MRFLYQPSGDRWPMFPHGGVYEVWFSIKRKIDGQDDLRMIFIVKVGDAAMPRRI